MEGGGVGAGGTERGVGKQSAAPRQAADGKSWDTDVSAGVNNQRMFQAVRWTCSLTTGVRSENVARDGVLQIHEDGICLHKNFYSIFLFVLKCFIYTYIYIL